MGTFTIRLSCGAGGPVFPKMVEGCLRAGEGRLILIGAFLPVGVQTGGAIKGTIQWPGPPRPSSKSASASRSTATCRPSSDPDPLPLVPDGAPHRHRARFGGGWWLSAMELPLPGVSPGMGRRRARAAAHPGEPCRVRRRRGLGPDQRLARPAGAASRSTPLHPRAGTRGSPIEAVVLTGAEIDQVAGLLSLREREPFTIFATAATLAALADNPMFGALAADLVTRRTVAPGEPLALPGGLAAELFTVPGKVPLYLEGENPDTASETAANVGVEISAGGARIAYVPGAAAVTAAMRERIARADVVLFDGTLFRDDEMIASGTGSKTGRRMGHMPIDGADGSLAALAGLAGRRIFVHINNTNPILIDGSPERARGRGARAGRSPRTGWRSCCEADDAGRARSAAARHRRAALSPPASVPRAAARRQVHARAGAGLGAQSLLLPGDDPGQGREPDRALRGSGAAARMALAAGRPRRRGRGRRRHRALAQADRRARARPRLCDLARRAPAGTRFAVEAYVHFVREKTLLEAIASSLTELFSPEIIGERVEGMLKSYDFVSAETLAYFAKRPPQAQRDADFALDYVKRHARTPDTQQAVLRGARIQMRRAVGDARRAAARLCRAQARAARRVRAEGVAAMSEPSAPSRHTRRCPPAPAARRAARPQRGAGRLGAAGAGARVQGRRDRGRDPQALHRRGDVRRDRRRPGGDLSTRRASASLPM